MQGRGPVGPVSADRRDPAEHPALSAVGRAEPQRAGLDLQGFRRPGRGVGPVGSGAGGRRPAPEGGRRPAVASAGHRRSGGRPGRAEPAPMRRAPIPKPRSSWAASCCPTPSCRPNGCAPWTARWPIAPSAVKANQFDVRAVNLGADLKDGILKLDPISFNFNRGELNGTAPYQCDQGHAPTMRWTCDCPATRWNRSFPRANGSVPLSGRALGRARLEGPGASIHDFAAASKGSMSLVVPNGRMRAAFAELLGINASAGPVEAAQRRSVREPDPLRRRRLRRRQRHGDGPNLRHRHRHRPWPRARGRSTWGPRR